MKFQQSRKISPHIAVNKKGNIAQKNSIPFNPEIIILSNKPFAEAQDKFVRPPRVRSIEDEETAPPKTWDLRKIKIKKVQNNDKKQKFNFHQRVLSDDAKTRWQSPQDLMKNLQLAHRNHPQET